MLILYYVGQVLPQILHVARCSHCLLQFLAVSLEPNMVAATKLQPKSVAKNFPVFPLLFYWTTSNFSHVCESSFLSSEETKFGYRMLPI